MEKIKDFFSNAVTLALLLVLGIGAILFLSNRSQNDELTAQTTKPTPTPIVEKTSLTPTIEKKVTPTPTVDTTIPEDDRPEPTWTPVIVLPDATSPPDPTPIPTPTATPVNPKEEILLKLESLAGQLAISVNDQDIAFNQLSADGSRNQLWKFNLLNKQLTRLSEFGGIPQWSPDGQAITFLRRYWPDSDTTGAKAEIRVVSLDGKNERILVDRNLSEVLDQYWIASDKIDIISLDGIEDVDQTGKITKRVNLALPDKVKNGSLPPKTDGSSGNFIVLNESPPLQIILHNGNRTIITDLQGRSISDFSLSSDKEHIAYIVIDGPVEELWVTDLAGKNQRKLFELPDGGSITTPRWSPDGKVLAIGHRATGTYYSNTYELALIDFDTGRITDLDIDQASSGFVWSHDGQWLYYTRALLIEPPETYDVTLYRTSVER